MSVIVQLKLPPELQVLIKQFVYYSKEETLQRIRKERLIGQLDRCKRLTSILPSLDPYFDLFYYKKECFEYYLYSDLIYIDYYYNVISAVFCKTCHNYLAVTNDIPRCIECTCMTDILDVD